MVHLPVVLIPLAGVVVVVLAFKPAWLDTVGAVVAAVVLVVSAGAATWTMAAAGHQGAKLAWCEETQNCSTGGGEGDEEGEYEEENEGG